MKKNEYVSPEMEIVEMMTLGFLAYSGGAGDGGTTDEERGGGETPPDAGGF